MDLFYGATYTGQCLHLGLTAKLGFDQTKKKIKPHLLQTKRGGTRARCSLMGIAMRLACPTAAGVLCIGLPAQAHGACSAACMRSCARALRLVPHHPCCSQTANAVWHWHRNTALARGLQIG